MNIDEAQALAGESLRKRQLDPDYRPTVDELKAIDTVLVEQAKKRLLESRIATAKLGIET